MLKGFAAAVAAALSFGAAALAGPGLPTGSGAPAAPAAPAAPGALTSANLAGRWVNRDGLGYLDMHPSGGFSNFHQSAGQTWGMYWVEDGYLFLFGFGAPQPLAAQILSLQDNILSIEFTGGGGANQLQLAGPSQLNLEDVIGGAGGQMRELAEANAAALAASSGVSTAAAMAEMYAEHMAAMSVIEMQNAAVAAQTEMMNRMADDIAGRDVYYYEDY